MYMTAKDMCARAGLSSDIIPAEKVEAGALTQVVLIPDLEQALHAMLNRLLLAPADKITADLARRKPEYVRIEEDGARSVRFRRVQRWAREQDAVAIGVLLEERQADGRSVQRVHLNPEQNARISFGSGDCVVLLADKEHAWAGR